MQFESHDWRSLYPFCSRHFELGNLRQHYLDEGTGRPLLMVHGNPTWSFAWRNQVLALRDRWRAIVPDHIGCGLSDKPQRYPYTLQQHIENLVQLVKHLDLHDTTLMAHDWGGAIGLGTALRLPERFSRVILFNTGAFPPPFVPWRIRLCRIPGIGEFAVRGLNLFARAALRMATTRPAELPPAVRDGLLAPYDCWANRVAIYRFVRDIPLSDAHPTWDTLEQIEQGLPSLADRPIQLLWGMRDWCFTPMCLERLHQHFPHAEIHRFDDAGHYVLEDAGDRIVPIVREFLSGTNQ
jgi:haloalkane dehalogenase